MPKKKAKPVQKALFMSEEELVKFYGDEVRGVVKDMEPTATHVVDKKLIPMYSSEKVRKALND